MQVISRSAAKAAGLKYFFTGEPCKCGHADVRFVSSYECRTCSYAKVLRIYHAKRPPTICRTCAVCRAVLPDDKNRKARYCSVSCRQNSRGRKYRDSEARHKRANRSRINSRQRDKYTNDPDFRARTQQSNNKSKKTRLAEQPDHMRAVSRRLAAKRRALQKQLFVEDVDPRVVFERDKGVCGICLGPVDPQSKWEIDHIIPLSKQGPHSYANVQLSHPNCNRKKWARLPSNRAS